MSELAVAPQHLAAGLADVGAHRGQRRAAAEQVGHAHAGVGLVAVPCCRGLARGQILHVESARGRRQSTNQ